MQEKNVEFEHLVPYLQEQNRFLKKKDKHLLSKLKVILLEEPY